MSYLSLLAVVLYLFWLLMSGYWSNGLLLTLGLVSTLLAVYIAWRIEKQHPTSRFFSLLIRLPVYWVWLIGEVIKSNIDVLKHIWLPKKYPISPTLKSLPMSQSTSLGKTIYANSITLTPGTVSVDVSGEKVLVHAISSDGIVGLQQGTMDSKVKKLEGSKP